MIEADNKCEIKEHSFRIPHIQFIEEGVQREAKDIAVEYKSTSRFHKREERDKGESSLIEELEIDYQLREKDSSLVKNVNGYWGREHIGFISCNKNKPENRIVYRGKKLPKGLYEFLVKELPEYVSRIIPKE